MIMRTGLAIALPVAVVGGAAFGGQALTHDQEALAFKVDCPSGMAAKKIVRSETSFAPEIDITCTDGESYAPPLNALEIGSTQPQPLQDTKRISSFTLKTSVSYRRDLSDRLSFRNRNAQDLNAGIYPCSPLDKDLLEANPGAKPGDIVKVIFSNGLSGIKVNRSEVLENPTNQNNPV